MISAARRRPSRDTKAQHREETALLVSLIRECQRADIPRQAVIVRLSRLPPERLKPHHLRLARAALEPLAHADRARMFVLPTQDIVTVWRGTAEAARSVSRTAVLHLFDGDDFVPPMPDDLWEELQLPRDAERLLSLSRGPEEEAPAPVSDHVMMPLDPAMLGRLEAQLAQADVARFSRRHPIARVALDGSVRLAWEKRVLCTAELADSMVPGRDVEADPWLFRRLTRTIDRRVLALLAAPGELTDAGPFAINLNVASVLAPEFLRFDTALPNGLRGKVTIDFMPEDILADPAAFLFARDFARARGYRLALQGVGADLLGVLPHRRLGLDLVHLLWSEDMPALDLACTQTEPQRIVLGQVATQSALDWGTGCGIIHFAGPLITERLKQHADTALLIG